MITVLQTAPKKKVTCHKCKSVLEYEFTDITTTSESDYSGCSEMVSRINCPVCQSQPIVKGF